MLWPRSVLDFVQKVNCQQWDSLVLSQYDGDDDGVCRAFETTTGKVRLLCLTLREGCW